ncbi:hypothetical protein ACFVXE_32340 [Streptomyces sp. NPDC058231]
MKKSEQEHPTKKADQVRPMKRIVVRRTEPIKVTSAPLNHQPAIAL